MVAQVHEAPSAGLRQWRRGCPQAFYVRRDLQRPHWQWGSAPHGWWGRGSAAGVTIATELSQPKSKRGGIRSGPIGSRALRPTADGVVVAPRDNYLTHDRYRARPATDKDQGQRFQVMRRWISGLTICKRL